MPVRHGTKCVTLTAWRVPACAGERALRSSPKAHRFLAAGANARTGEESPVAFTYDYPMPSVAADVVLLRPGEASGASIEVLLIERANEPFRGRWALPGGFVEIDEDLQEGARRELREETGIDIGPDDERFVQLGAFGRPGRDPRGRVISVVYLAGVCRPGSEPTAGDDAARAEWFPLSKLPELAFDHAEILAEARRRIEREPGLVADL